MVVRKYPVLSWDKPKKKMSHEEWQKSYQADGAPPGVYSPNMSEADEKRWKAKIFGGKLPRVEIRKTAGSQVKIVVSLTNQPWERRDRFNSVTGKFEKMDCGYADNVVISMNGPAHFTFGELEEFQEAIKEAKMALEAQEKAQQK